MPLIKGTMNPSIIKGQKTLDIDDSKD